MTRKNCYLAFGVFAMLAAILRLGYLETLPQPHCESFWGIDKGCAVLMRLGVPVS
ncbi:MAG TPA: hypothetical protein VF475_14100 [Sphingobium sp.]